MSPSSSPVLTAFAAVAFLLTACTEDPDSQPSGGADPPSSSPSSSPTGEPVRATRISDVASSDALLEPGLYAMGVASEEADPPMVVIDVPAGYHGRGDGYEISAEPDGAGFRHFDTRTVSQVATKPCGDPEWVDPGPGVEDLAGALAALPVWESTRPEPRTIGGHAGVFMELNVPARLPAKCYGNFRSWLDYHGSSQGIGPGKTQRLRIVDVDGQRLMLVAGYFPGAEGPTQAQIDEMTEMAEGAMFVDEDQIVDG